MASDVRAPAGRQVDTWGLAALAVGACSIAFSGILMRLSDLEPMASATYRVALAIPVLLAWDRVAARRAAVQQAPFGRRGRVLLGICGLAFAGDLICWHMALTMTTVANSTLIGNFAPVFVTLGSVVLLGARPRRLFAVGLVVALLGAVLLVKGAVARPADGGSVAGDLISVLTAMFYGAYLLTVGYLRGTMRATTVMLWTAIVSAAILGVIALSLGQSLRPASWQGWLVVLGLGVGVQALGQGAIAWSLGHVPAMLVSVALVGQPVLTGVIAWVILGEAITALQAAGIAIILCGIELSRRGS